MAVITGFEVGDEPEGWVAAGFAVEPGGLRVGNVRIELTGTDGDRGLRRWLLDPAAVADLDGLASGGRPAPGGDAPEHPNGAILVDHVVVFSPDVDRTTDVFAGAGLDLRRVRAIPGSAPARVQVFFRAGEVIVELVGEEQAHGAGPALFYGLAFTVADLDATAALLGDVISEIRPAVQPGRRVATLRHRDLGISIPIIFLSQRARHDATRAGASET